MCQMALHLPARHLDQCILALLNEGGEKKWTAVLRKLSGKREVLGEAQCSKRKDAQA